MITAIETSSAATADHFLFKDEARDRLLQADVDDTLTRVKLLTNLAFFQEYDGYEQYREQAQHVLLTYRLHHDEPLVHSYWWTLRVMEIRDWNFFRKIGGGPKGEVKKAFDSLSAAMKFDPYNENIRFLRAGVAVEAAKNIPEMLDLAKEDLQYLDEALDRTDEGAKFFLELLWAKYYYWRSEKGEKHIKQRFLIFAQFHVNEAYQYAQFDTYRNEIVLWYKRIIRKKPKTSIWSEEVLTLVKNTG